MTKNELYKALDYVSASREKRSSMANLVKDQPHLIPILIEIIKENQDPISCKASWVLEYVAKKDLVPILKHLNEFIEVLPILHLESSIRPAAKICELLLKAYSAKKPHPVKKTLLESHLKIMGEVAFDWLIGNHKVAAKAHSMSILLLLGHKITWIHPELQQILNQNYTTGSPAYKARARITLNTLEKIIK